MDSEQKRDCITITGSLQHIPNAVTVSKTRPWSKIIDDCLSNDSVSVEPGPPSPGPVPPSTDPVPIIPVALPAAALVVVLAVATAGLVVVRKVVVRRRNLHGNLDSDSTESTPLLTSRVDFHSSTAAADPQPILAINHEAPPIQSTTPVPKPITYTADEQSITSDFGTSHGSTRSQSSTTLRGGSSSDSDKPQQDDRKDIVPPSVNPYRKRKPPVHNSNRTPIQDLSYHQPTSPPMQPNGPTNSSDYLVPKSSDSSDSLDARRPASQSPTPSSSSGSSNGSGYEGDDEMST